MKVIVPKGKHYSRKFKWLPFNLPHIFIHSGYHVVTCDIVITESMFYDDSSLGQDKYDINKVVGFSRGYHMNNSCRLGYNCIDGKLRFYSFIHDGGKQVYRELVLNEDVKVGDSLFLMLTDDHNKTHCYLGHNDYSIENIHLKNTRFKKDSIKISYYLRPYIGGNKPAVQNIKFHIIDLW